MIKQGGKKKKSWTFLQIQLPLHHLIQSNKFAFCLHPVFRGPVNKTGRINLMCFHGSAWAPPPPFLFATFYLEYLNSHESVNTCHVQMKLKCFRRARSVLSWSDENNAMFEGEFENVLSEMLLSGGGENADWHTAQAEMMFNLTVSSHTPQPYYRTRTKASLRRWSQTKLEAYHSEK